MDARTRFAKMFRLTSENGKMWILRFVENRVGVPIHYKDLKEFITVNNIESKDHKTGTITRALPKIRKSSDLDITALNVIIKLGKILKGKPEKKSLGHAKNTIGDLIDRLQCLRNEIVHSGEASLEVDDYNDHLDELRDIAKHFERVNGVAQDTYKQEIDHIDGEKWADKEVQDTLQLYQNYLENILQSQLFQTALLNSTSRISNNNGSKEDRLHIAALEEKIVILNRQLNLAIEANHMHRDFPSIHGGTPPARHGTPPALHAFSLSNVRSALFPRGDIPHPECYYCRSAHTPVANATTNENQESCHVM